MASKQSRTTQKELIDALCAAGYELDGFARKGDNLIVRLTPAYLIEHEQHVDRAVCEELGLQARCSVFAQIPQPLLIVTVYLPAVSPKPQVDNAGDDV